MAVFFTARFIIIEQSIMNMDIHKALFVGAHLLNLILASTLIEETVHS